ncbi:MAG: hypothetical protein GY861_10845 [bacterium]|nr:hypothetical protein [bacterium]
MMKLVKKENGTIPKLINSICIEMDEQQYLKSVEWVKNCTESNPYGISQE